MSTDNIAKKNTLFESGFLSVAFFVCSLMVVGIHSYNITDTTVNTVAGYIESFLCHGIFIAAVPVFFFFSGYLFFRNISTTKDVFNKMKTRAKSVLMPFLVWSALYLLIFTIGSFTPFFSSEGVSFAPLDILKGIVFYRYCFPLWYMYQLVMFVLLTPLINVLLKKRYLSLGLLVVLTVISIFIKSSFDVEVFPGGERSLFQINFFCYYFAGCLAVKFSDEFIKLKEKIENKRGLFAVVSGLALVIFAFLQSIIFEERVTFFYNRFFVPFVFVCLFIFLWCVYEKIPYIKNASTMVVYGVHSIIGTVLINVFSGIFSKFPTIISFLIAYVVVAFLSFLFAYIVKRFMKPIHFVLSGGR